MKENNYTARGARHARKWKLIGQECSLEAIEKDIAVCIQREHSFSSISCTRGENLLALIEGGYKISGKKNPNQEYRKRLRSWQINEDDLYFNIWIDW